MKWALKDYSTSEELIHQIKNWIKYYNSERIQVKLNGQSPVKFRQLAV